MFKPPHPGLFLKNLLVSELNLTITQSAKLLGISRLALSKIINEHSGISPEMAFRLSIAFKTSGEMWLNMQMTYDLWQVRKEKKNLLKELKSISNINSRKAS